MLVLTRKSAEKITIGDDVIVNILEIKGSHVKLGVEAPRGVPVHRGEVYDRIQEQNILAAGVEASDFAAAERLWKPQRMDKKSGRK